MSNNLKKFLTFLAFLIMVIGSLAYLNRVKIKELFFELKKKSLPQAQSVPQIKSSNWPNNQEEKLIVIPKELNIKVPFLCQSPYQVWDHLHNEACEEAALIMIHHFLQGDDREDIPKDEGEKEIKEMVAWQEKNWGGHFDLNAQNIAKLASEYYGYKNIEIKYDFTLDDLKKELALGNPVLVPVAGRLLGNPFYKQPGPIYHNLVVVGFTPKVIITNDPGIWQGNEFQFSYEKFFNALHDWVDGSKEDPELIKQGRKVMIIIKKD